jgi:hypothetical protein
MGHTLGPIELDAEFVAYRMARRGGIGRWCRSGCYLHEHLALHQRQPLPVGRVRLVLSPTFPDFCASSNVARPEADTAWSGSC